MTVTFENALRNAIEGEVRFDPVSKKVYSVDASIYEVEPVGIVLPKTREDVIAAVKIAHTYGIPVIARGAATGISGGCIGNGLIVDTSKYLNKILEINFEEEYAVCEPGVIQDRLNEALAQRGYRLGPDTSTGNRATIGGMLANNSAGARSLRYGKMVDHVEAVEMVLGSGEVLEFYETDWVQKKQQQDTEGHIYREIDRIRTTFCDEIDRLFPKIPRRVSGYNLDQLLTPNPNLCGLITGSEGTLGIVTSIRVHLSKVPGQTVLCIVHFDNMLQGMHAIQDMLAFEPLSLEMIDRHIIETGRLSPSMHGKLDWLQGNPEAVFVAEFDHKQETAFIETMHTKSIGYACTCLSDPIQQAHVWAVRKSGLGLLLSKRSYNRAIAFIEDLSIAPEHLPAFMEKFLPYLKSFDKEAGIYGHVGSGCLHIRPYLDLKNEAETMQTMMEEVATMVLEHGGALSGEHGDGLIRSWLNRKMFGDTLYQAFKEVKRAFDPENRMNPGKIVNAPPVLEHLRQSRQKETKTFLNFSKEGGFDLAVDMCNGNGLCRKKEKIMCPSFQATNDEYDTTRARAQALRTLSVDQAYDILDLCLECKGCKTECPSQVDMAKMKAEFLYQYQEKHGYSLRSRLFGHIGRLNQWTPYFFNSFGKTSVIKWMLSWLGITPERNLPLLAKEPFSKWFRKQPHSGGKEQVVLFNDTFTEFNEPQIGKAALKVLQTLGYDVIVPQWQCCGRPLISKGMLKQARKKAERLMNTLRPYAEAGLPIIGLEPSCILTIKDDFQGLVNDVEVVMQACTTFDEFVAKHVHEGKLQFREKNINVMLHGHCHQKSLVGTQATLDVLRSIPGCTVTEIPSGCCGMAGSFGYEKEHYALSLKIAELQLFPAIRASSPDTIIVANGISCRSQITHGTGAAPKHLAELINHLTE